MLDPRIPNPDQPLRFVVVTPTYNHGTMVRGVLDSLVPLGFHIIVVNDGSKDDTHATLSAWASEGSEQRTVVTHDVNQGKAAALLTGFARAREMGFTHALTIDSDGQHAATDLAGIIEISRRSPTAIVVGARAMRLPGCPWTSRLGRRFSNRCVWIASGVRVKDSQSGLRSYPLAIVELIGARADRYGFETEILTRAGWAGVPVIESPITCVYEVSGGRVTHFRVGKDSLDAVRMHSKLIGRALLPVNPALDAKGRTLPPVPSVSDEPTNRSIPSRLWWWMGPQRLWAMVRGDAETRRRLSASVGVGMFMAAAPFYGFKTVACLWASAKFRLHPAAVIAVSSLATPPIGFLFVLAGVMVGHFMLHGTWLTSESIPEWETLTKEIAWKFTKTFLAAWIVGSMVVVAPVLGALAFVATRVLLRFIPPAAVAPVGQSPIRTS